MNRAPEIYHNLVATDDQVIIGFISVIFYKTLFHKGGTALINELVVEAAYRGRGVAAACSCKGRRKRPWRAYNPP